MRLKKYALLSFLLLAVCFTGYCDDTFIGTTDKGHKFTFKTNSAYHGAFIYSPGEVIDVSHISFDNYYLFGKEIKKVTYFIDNKKLKTIKNPPYNLYYQFDRLGKDFVQGNHQFKIKIDYAHDAGAVKFSTEFVFPLKLTNDKPAPPTVKIGYTKQQCLDAWGEPINNEKSVLYDSNYNEKEVKEILYYENGRFLYFINGILENFKETY